MQASSNRLPAGFLPALCHTYADLLRRQRTAGSPLVRWGHGTRRAQEFVWLGGAHDREQLMHEGTALRFGPSHPLYETIHKMYGTARLNPYEREILYGYPYLIGRMKGRAIRGPLLTLSVTVEPIGSELRVQPADEVVRFNSLPFRTENDPDTHEQALGRIMEATPTLPITPASLETFAGALTREIPTVKRSARLDGALAGVPEEPHEGEFLEIIDQAALFLAPKTNYFLGSDLETIAGGTSVACPCLQPLLIGAGDEEQVEFSDSQIDSAQLFFPLPSNRAQRRVALLVEDPTTRVIRVEGPPGTGKSHTIANLAAHLAATGRRVLITSQKDKALEVVDDKLRDLDLAELPMTLLRQDRDSKRELLSRLERAAEKKRYREEVETEYERFRARFAGEAKALLDDARSYASAIRWEDAVERAHRDRQAARGLSRLFKGFRFWRVRRKARRRARETTDELATRAAARRKGLQGLGKSVLQVGAELAVAGAKRAERQVVRELQDVLKRDQKAHKNFSLFDRLKQQTEQADRLLRILPVWILSPDDIARLFPLREGLFDVVIVDEASQVDLPSVLPVAFRGSKLVIFGDTKQMQSQRFAFMSANVALEAWERFGMEAFDPDHRLDPVKESLLNLAAIRAEEESLLDEHFRSLPPIIDFSNRRWYDSRLRIMTDTTRKKFGGPGHPVIALHQVEDGIISNESQENEREAEELVEFLARIVKEPEYEGASIGVLCLFDEQVDLVNELVTDRIGQEEWTEHNLVVVNPDGFQGDERDVILYSLSWDDKVMPRAALSARQADYPHIQGMLNVAFTRARDEIHVFHSAPIDSFGMAGGQPGALGDWMNHCENVERGVAAATPVPPDQVDSAFEREVAGALRAQGIEVLHRYPACGLRIDLVCVRGGRRIAVECDGALRVADDDEGLRVDDAERQAVLERAGWTVIRIPYRLWLVNPQAQIAKVTAVLPAEATGGSASAPSAVAPPAATPAASPAVPREPTDEESKDRAYHVTPDQKAVIVAIRSGAKLEAEVLRTARIIRGHSRMGTRIKGQLLAAAQELRKDGVLVVEDGEYFLTAEGREAVLWERPEWAGRKPGDRRSRRRPPPNVRF